MVKGKESNPTDASADTPPTHYQRVGKIERILDQPHRKRNLNYCHFENETLIPRSPPSFFLRVGFLRVG